MPTLTEIRAKDLMQTEVITLVENAPISEAIQTFEECNIKGAPVVDAAGNPVGVLSATDIAHTSHMRDDRIENRRGDYYLTDPSEEFFEGSRQDAFFGKEDYSPEILGAETIGNWMTPHVISVYPDATIREVCRVMRDESIHRVLVVKQGKILGILSTFDIVRFLAGDDS